jgi:hypothetical protein
MMLNVFRVKTGCFKIVSDRLNINLTKSSQFVNLKSQSF